MFHNRANYNNMNPSFIKPQTDLHSNLKRSYVNIGHGPFIIFEFVSLLCISQIKAKTGDVTLYLIGWIVDIR